MIAYQRDRRQKCFLKIAGDLTSAQREGRFLRELHSQRDETVGSRSFVPFVFAIHELPSGRAFIDMEDVGTVLDSKHLELKADSRLSATLGLELLEAVSFIHSKGIAHLDIKPLNVTVRHGQPHLCIIDFNASRPAPDPTTTFDSFVGTKDWVPPEIANIDIGTSGPPFSLLRADLWECGKLLHWMIEDELTRGRSNLVGVEDALKRLRSYAATLLSDDPLQRSMPDTQALQQVKALLVKADTHQAVSGSITLASKGRVPSPLTSPPAQRHKLDMALPLKYNSASPTSSESIGLSCKFSNGWRDDFIGVLLPPYDFGIVKIVILLTSEQLCSR